MAGSVNAFPAKLVVGFLSTYSTVQNYTFTSQVEQLPHLIHYIPNGVLTQWQYPLPK